MSIARENIKALCFDFGNTLVEFGPRQVAAQYETFERTLTGLFGPCDAARFKAVRDRQRAAPLSNGYKESELTSLSQELIRELYDVEPDEHHIEVLNQTRCDSLADAIELNDEVLPLLRELRRRYRLGLLSNYPCSRSVRNVLAKVGLLDIFEVVVISGDVGYVKPHTRPFEAMLSQMGLAPSECLYVGDNWLADIQGAKQIGMRAVLTTQYTPHTIFKPVVGDHLPDARIAHLDELRTLLLS